MDWHGKAWARERVQTMARPQLMYFGQLLKTSLRRLVWGALRIDGKLCVSRVGGYPRGRNLKVVPTCGSESVCQGGGLDHGSP